MAVNKVIYGGDTLIDLTADSVTPSNLLQGATAHDKSGTKIDGACKFDADTSDGTVAAAEILSGKKAYARGTAITGTMKNNGSVSGSINTVNGEFTIEVGYHDGSGKVKIDATEKAKLVPGNIKQGVSVLGVTGTLEPSSNVKTQSKTVTPLTTQQTIIPDEGIDYLSQVIVNAIPYTETENSAGGITVTIAG